MTTNETKEALTRTRTLFLIFIVLMLTGLAGFMLLVSFGQYARAWQTYLVNFLFWSAIAQGGLLFSVIMHVTRARWSQPLQNLAEAFVAFFPISFVLFLLLFIGQEHVFPWIHEDLHGKEVWLNIPFLFTRDLIGLFLLYGFGFLYCLYALKSKIRPEGGRGLLRSIVKGAETPEAAKRYKDKMTPVAILYMISYASVLTLISFDLVMSMDPHFISTLFGGYFFIKALYIGLGGIIILASVIVLNFGTASTLTPDHFHDIGKLFFAFCIVWAYFLYAQVLVIWYGNVPEDAHYLVQRFLPTSWRTLVIFIFLLSFVLPFFSLINAKLKTRPQFMIVLCSLALTGIWLDNLLLIGPPMHFDIKSLPLRLFDILISLGFLGLMASALTYFLKQFPELFLNIEEKVS